MKKGQNYHILDHILGNHSDRCNIEMTEYRFLQFLKFNLQKVDQMVRSAKHF